MGRQQSSSVEVRLTAAFQVQLDGKVLVTALVVCATFLRTQRARPRQNLSAQLDN